MSHSIDEDIWMEDQSHQADIDVRGAVGSDPSGSTGRFEPSVKLRARIEKLAHWRINPSSIDFPSWRNSKSYGGHATVSRGEMSVKKMNMRDIEKQALDKKLDRNAMDPFLTKKAAHAVWWSSRDVAVKKMRVADDTDFERLLGLTIREAEFLAELDHRNIVELEGFVEDVSKSIIWLVFPWAHHGNLKDFVARGKLEIPERISLISDVAHGLEYLHSREPPICHGDLKSLNVLIYKDSVYEFFQHSIYARITDFGSARRLPQRDPNTRTEEVGSQRRSGEPLNVTFNPSTNTITLTGNKYTLRWAAPELLMDDQLDLWSDIWALGWVAYEVMTESLPFEDVKSDAAVVERVVEGNLPSLTDNAHLSLIHELCSLMNTCWKLQPTQRPTADFCRQSIERMPRFAPEMDKDTRILNSDRLSELGHTYQSRGDYARAFYFFVQAFEASKADYENGVKTEPLSFLRNLAQLAQLRKEYSKTIALYDFVWDQYRSMDGGSFDVLGGAFCDLAELHRLQNECNKSIKLKPEGREIQEQERIAEALYDIARHLRGGNEYDVVIRLYSQVLEIRTDFGDRRGKADALLGLADVHRRQSEYEDAIRLYSQVLEIRTDLGDRSGKAHVLWGLAEVHRGLSEYEEAIPLYSHVLEIRTKLDDRGGTADALCGLADVHRSRSEYEEAIRLYSQVLEIRTDLGDRRGEAAALCGLADVHGLRSEYEEAIPLYYGALGICTDIDDIEGKVAALLGLAYVHHEEGDDAECLFQPVSEILEQSWRLADRTSYDEWLFGLHIELLHSLFRRQRRLAGDLTKGLPTETGFEGPTGSRWLRRQYDEPNKTDVRAGELLQALWPLPE